MDNKRMKSTVFILFNLFSLTLTAQWPSADTNNPNYDKCSSDIKLANEIESQAFNYLAGNKYSNWKKRKRINKSRKEFRKAIKVYEQAQSMNCVNSDDLKFKIINCLNQIEKFSQSKKIIKTIIDSSRFNREFFRHYFMTLNRVSGLKNLRENGHLYESCGGSPEVIDSEHYYSHTILLNASKLYRNKKYNLLLEYLNQSKFRINWSEDVRLNRINTILSQLFLKALLQTYSIEEINQKFDDAKIISNEWSIEGIGESMNYPTNHLKLYNYVLNIYTDKPSSYAVKYQKESDQDAIIDLGVDSEDEIKEKTIFQEQIKKMLSITVDIRS